MQQHPSQMMSMNPTALGSSSTIGKITDDVLASLEESSRAAYTYESRYFRFVGPRFSGDYENADCEDLLFAFLQMAATDTSTQFERTRSDHQKLYQILAQAENPTRAREVEAIARRAYQTAEARVRSTLLVLERIAAHYDQPDLFDDYRQACSLNWEIREGFERAMRAKEAELDRMDSDSRPSATACGGGGACEAGDSASAPVDGHEAGEESVTSAGGQGGSGPK